MTVSTSPVVQNAFRRASAGTLGLCLVFGAVGCGGEETSEPTPTSDAEVVGASDGRLQLTEGIDYTMRTGNDAVGAVQLATNEEDGEPTVVISVSRGKDSEEEHTLSLGDTVDIGEDVWRVSEIGMSDSDAQPGSATLVREEN